MTSVSASPEPHNGISRDEIYRAAVEEYRFQAQFNWSRVQYLLAFNVAILAAGVALAPKSGALAISVFVLGAVSAAMTLLVHRIQHGYYRNARDRMRRVQSESEVAARELVDTTSTLKGDSRRISVTQIINLLLVAIAIADLAT